MSLSNLLDSRFIKFVLVGVLNTIFGYSVYAALLFIKFPYLIALLVATIAGVVFNYFSFGRIAFNGHKGWAVFLKFIIAYALIYTINALLLKLLIDYLIINNYLAQIMCIPVNVFLSWVFMSLWVYKEN
ncbi:MAG: GtrA family protein [Undibacterium sp.]|uniref:GtrA family protein n=1 Tax=Undibacterium sp. TaxID=1914977 RepID=UPI002723B1B4|nr:GtrA family protein [Undibacterium sp.]MDO8654254.1 GtrA family protein [Undibacterium sp.]